MKNAEFTEAAFPSKTVHRMRIKLAGMLGTALLLAPQVTLKAQSADLYPDGNHATASRLEEFLGDPVFVPMQKLWDGRGGWGGILTAQDGTVVAFQSPGGGNYRRSRDGGKTWDAEKHIAPEAINGRALVDETTGDILYVNPGAGWLFRSRDQGATWTRESVQARPDGFGNIPDEKICPAHGYSFGVTAMQAGITLAFGKHKGRLIIPARVPGPEGSNHVESRAYHYSTALYSDNGGVVWQTSKPFPVLGTGEAALAELSDGSILYNSREHMTRGNRYLAHSYDGGDLWIGPYRSPDLPDGPRGTSYGLLGGMVRLPVAGHDILLYSNLETDAGVMPAEVGGSTGEEREKVTVWASFDGGRSWPVKRLVHDGPGAYSTLAVGRTGTPSEGRIYLLFEGGPENAHGAVQVVAFNLSWLLDGRDITSLIGMSPAAAK
jgi:sialidase-1